MGAPIFYTFDKVILCGYVLNEFGGWGGEGWWGCTFARIPNLIEWCTSACQNRFLIPSVYPPRIAWHHSFKKFSLWLDPLQISAEGHFFLLALSACHQCSKVPIFTFNTPATFEGPPPTLHQCFFWTNFVDKISWAKYSNVLESVANFSIFQHWDLKPQVPILLAWLTVSLSCHRDASFCKDLIS